jgi:hypothetical protein
MAVDLGHVVRAHGRPVWGNSMVDDFDVSLTAFTLEQRIDTVDQESPLEISVRKRSVNDQNLLSKALSEQSICEFKGALQKTVSGDHTSPR